MISIVEKSSMPSFTEDVSGRFTVSNAQSGKSSLCDRSLDWTDVLSNEGREQPSNVIRQLSLK